MGTTLNTYRDKVLFDVILSAKTGIEHEKYNGIPDEMFNRLMQHSEEQIERGEFILQDEMERLVASW